MIRPLLILAIFFTVAFTSWAAPWHLSVENATKTELRDVSVSWDKHKITFGILGYNTGYRVKAEHLFVSDAVGGRVPTNAVIRYTTTDKRKHDVTVAVPKAVVVGRRETLVFSISDDEKISVRKDE
jgi:hypothetical protein